ncbi:MAG: CBS domain-containing protein [Planctomycetota bacterium]|jgi:CBS domain-containing protein
MASENLSETKKNCQPLGGVAILEENAPEKAKDVARYGVITIRRQESVYKAIEIMVGKNVSGLPVVDDTGLVGIISEKDVLRLLYGDEFLTGSVGEYMTENVTSFATEDNLADVCDCLVKNDFRRVPILHEGKLVGIISRADLIRAYKDKFRPQAVPERSTGPRRGSALARDIMKCGLLTVRRQTPIYEAMDMLATRNITGLPVVDDCMNLVGIISEKDMLKLICDPNARAGDTEEFMTEKVVSFNHDDSLYDVCDCLVNNSFRRVPILNQGKVVGIISRADVMLHILKNKSGFFRQRSRQ